MFCALYKLTEFAVKTNDVDFQATNRPQVVDRWFKLVTACFKVHH